MPYSVLAVLVFDLFKTHILRRIRRKFTTGDELSLFLLLSNNKAVIQLSGNMCRYCFSAVARTHLPHAGWPAANAPRPWRLQPPTSLRVARAPLPITVAGQARAFLSLPRAGSASMSRLAKFDGVSAWTSSRRWRTMSSAIKRHLAASLDFVASTHLVSR